MNQARYWLLTIPQHEFLPYQPRSVSYIAGQLETAPTTGYLHWQIVIYFEQKHRLQYVKRLFGRSCHAEPTRSAAAREYVFKDETAVPGTRFELGSCPKRRCNSQDWGNILQAAKTQQYDQIPADIYVRYYGNIKRIGMDNLQPVGIYRRAKVYWGPTGTGKSRRAWEEAGMGAYPKDPRSKFWDGYKDQKHVVVDEFRGNIDISHLLRWLDRYPVIVEVKGSSTALVAECFWFTSNIPPRQWYPDLDESTIDALLRRLEVEHMAELII